MEIHGVECMVFDGVECILLRKELKFEPLI